MPKAIDVAINQTILSDTALISVLRDANALCYVRNPQTLEVHEETFADVFRDAADALAGTPAAAEAFYRRNGPAGAQGRRRGAEEILAAMKGPPGSHLPGSQGLLEPHRNLTSPRPGGDPTEIPRTKRYTCYVR